MKLDIKNVPTGWIVNNRYQIYKADGAVYDTIKAEDIPYEIFEIRDNLMAKKLVYGIDY